ncbi:MAG TPA: tetratricopeptide repeat protein [Candidatus Obscuribacterales bacterium]
MRDLDNVRGLRTHGPPSSLAGVFVAVLVCLAIWLSPACRGQASAGKTPDPAPATIRPAIEWTKIQDLRPEARATNRPVKDKWAVVVGIGTFAEQALNNGIAMDRAAREFYNYLVDPRAGRFDKDHVVLLTDSEATRQNILSVTGPQWLGRVAGPDDLVVIFIGTHGFPSFDGNTYLLAHNSALDNLFATGISMKSLMESLRKDVRSDRIVLVLQACYSGAAELTAGAKALHKNFNVDLERITLGKGYMIASSSRPDQITWGDVFSKNLIKALRDKEGLVPFTEAFSAAERRTEYDTTHECVGCRPQNPVLKADWTGKDLVLGVPPVAKVASVPAEALNFLGAEAHYMRASQAAAAGDLEAAIQGYRSAIAADPHYADAYGDLGSALALTGKWDEAADQLRKAVALRPSDALFHANLARVLAKLGKDAESAQELKTAYGLNPKDRHVLTALADRALRSGDPASAVRYLKEALELYPKSAALHDRLSYALTKSGDLVNAQAHAEEAVTYDPSSPSARMNLGSILLLRRNLPDAITAYRAAVKLAPDDPDARYLLSSALEKAHDKAGAQAELAKFVELCKPGDPRLEPARQHLQALTAR